MHSRLIGDYHAQHAFAAYNLHDRAGTLASILYIYIRICNYNYFTKINLHLKSDLFMKTLYHENLEPYSNM